MSQIQQFLRGTNRIWRLMVSTTLADGVMRSAWNEHDEGTAMGSRDEQVLDELAARDLDRRGLLPGAVNGEVSPASGPEADSDSKVFTVRLRQTWT
jgi:hypothetical protein